jgi:hypothetical protein
MHTITLTVSDEAKDKFLWLLSHFLPDEVKQEPIAQTAQSVITSGKQITDFLRQQIPLSLLAHREVRMVKCFRFIRP